MQRLGTFILLLSLIAPGCSDDDNAAQSTVDPAVVVSGASGLRVGETLQLTAATRNGDDSSYTWRAVDELIATVDDTGVVTGVGAGETDVVATGTFTGAAGRHRVVVIEVLIDGDLELIPYYDLWHGSAHADPTAEAFVHWDEDGEIPTSCARCHSTSGYQDYIGADGSDPEVVDTAHPIGSVVDCNACHNAAASELSEVVFPSGTRISGLGSEARCMTCHQGRASTDTVDENIAAAAAPDDDTVDADLSFTNIHYYAAGATLLAGRVRGGYQYEGKVYDWRFRHVPGIDNCVGCHDPHSLEVRVDTCQGCHATVETVADVRDVRMLASRSSDYDGDGDVFEGIFYEVEGLKAQLLSDIRTYASAHGGDICWDGGSYPYWFSDSNGNNLCDEGEAAFSNAYKPWTARLTRAVYNYTVASKDPGGFAHNGKYMIQLLHDAIADLNSVAASPRDLSALVRNDPGHFNGASEAARHWDEDEEVSASCSKCHSGSEGLEFFLEFGVGTGVEEPDNGLDCATCHTEFGASYALREVSSVTFPSGVTIGEDPQVDYLCMTCHSGREAKSTVDAAIASDSLGFKNVHYLPAGAIRLGSDAHVGYEYDGKTYTGQWTGHPGGDSCVDCHDPLATNHSFEAADNIAYCNQCHVDAIVPSDIRWPAAPVDVDGDQDIMEPLSAEISTLAEALYARIQAVAKANGKDVCYAEAYPYFFIDTDGSGSCEGAEGTFGNRYDMWTPVLMKAAFNYQIFEKEPGAWAHNFAYVAQLLIDSIEDAGGDVSGYTRP